MTLIHIASLAQFVATLINSAVSYPLPVPAEGPALPLEWPRSPEAHRQAAVSDTETPELPRTAFFLSPTSAQPASLSRARLRHSTHQPGRGRLKATPQSGPPCSSVVPA